MVSFVVVGGGSACWLLLRRCGFLVVCCALCAVAVWLHVSLVVSVDRGPGKAYCWRREIGHGCTCICNTDVLTSC